MDNNKPIVYYTNNIGITSSNFDFSFLVAHRTNPATEPNQPPKPEEIMCEIVMSPQHAKAFAITLMQNIKQYEDLFGELALQPDMEKYKKFIAATKKVGDA